MIAVMAKLRLNDQNIATAVLYGVLGVLLCVLRMGMLNVLMTLVGILFLAIGIYDIVTYFLHRTRVLTRGVVETLIGIVIIVCGWTITTWVLIIFGVLLAIKGVIDLVHYFQLRYHHFPTLMNILLLIAVGVILCIAPFAIGDVICIIVGIMFIIEAVLALFGKTII